MGTTAWKRAKQIFHEALEKSGPQRAGFVVSACGEDRDLRLQVEALLNAHDEAGEFLTSPTVPEADAAARAATTLTEAQPTERPGATIGPYKLLQVIGEGGFGVVYMAEQEEPVRRRVALKIIKLGMDTKQVIARFEAERQALALMEHSNIARVFDAGATETGRPYFVMELVKGVPITEYCDSNRLTTRERLDLFTEICSAIQHAHQKGIVHRDLKPSNVLVTLHDGKPVPKVIDFGISKAMHQRLTEKTLFTAYGQFIGTPVYMSPEQAEMSGLDVDTRSDIYSLGVLLYELITGTTPFDLNALREAGFGEIQRIIREDEPPKPSTRLSTLGGALSDIAKHRRTDPGRLTRLVRGDLDWIVMKALEKSRTRRYDSASELAADLVRHLDDEPVVARPPSTTYRLQKFVKKHKGPVTAVSAVVITALVLGSVAFWQGQVAQRQAARVRAASILTSAEASDDPLLKAQLILELADLPELPGRLRAARDAADHALPLAVLRGHEGPVFSVDFSPDGDRVAAGGADSTVRVWRADGTGAPVVLRGHDPSEGLVEVAFSPDGRQLLSASFDGTARVWPADGNVEPVVLAGHRHWVRGAAFSPDGRLVATVSNDGTARVWQTDGTGEPVVLRGHESIVVLRVLFSPDGSRVLTASGDGTARLWPVDGTGEVRVFRHGHSVWNLAQSPDGSRVATAGGKTVRVWNTDGPDHPVVLNHEDGLASVAFSPDAAFIVTGTRSGRVRVWRADGSGEPVLLQGHEQGTTGACFSPDGRLVAVSSMDGTARVWRADGSGFPVVLGRHEGGVYDLAFSPDGTQLATGGADGTVRVWRPDASGETVVLWPPEEHVGRAVFNPDGTRVLTDGEFVSRVWRSDGTGHPIELEGDSAAFSPDGDRVITSDANGRLRIWQADGAEDPVILEGHSDFVWSAAFSPDGSRVATASEDGTVRVWRADGTGDPVVLRGHEAGVARVAFGPDGDRLAIACIDGSVWVWPADGNGEPVILPGPEEERLTSHFFIWKETESARQRRTVNAYWDETRREWCDESTREPIVLPDSMTGFLASYYWTPDVALSPDGSRALVVATGTVWPTDGSGDPVVLREQGDLYNGKFSPDGSRVVAGFGDGMVRVWHADGTGEPVELRGHTNEVYCTAFSPDGRRVVSGSIDYTARVRKADGSGEALILRGHNDAILHVSFSPDGGRVLTASWDGTARVWRVTWPGLLAYLRESLKACMATELRMRFLAESASEAWDTFAACERRQGREPELQVTRN